MNTLRLRAEHSAQKFYNKRQNEPLEALAGDGAGNVDVTGRLNWIWVRVDGNAEAVTVAFNKSGHEFTEDDSIQIQWVKRTGLGYYEIVGYSGSVVYDNPSDTTETTVRAHAPQHERRDQGQGGFDPLDIYARMVVPLRARPQTSPNLTLHVEAGYNPLTGNYYAGGDSAAFSAPAGLAQAKIDLLYLGSDDALHIVAGAPVAGGSPTLPALVLPSVPLAFVYLSTGQTTITESNIYRDPGILRSPVFTAGALAPHDLLDGSLDQDTVAHTVAEDDLIVGTAAPKWDGLAKGADRSYVGINPASHHVAYLYPLVFNVRDYGAVGNGIANDTTAVQAAINAANGAGGGIVFFPPRYVLL